MTIKELLTRTYGETIYNSLVEKVRELYEGHRWGDVTDESLVEDWVINYLGPKVDILALFDQK